MFVFIFLVHIGKTLVSSLGVAHGGHRQHVHPASLKSFKRSEHLPIHLTISTLSSFCLIELMKSREEHTLSSFAVGSERIPEILDCIGGSQRFSVKKSASSTSRFFSAGPRFSASTTGRSNQSSINSSYLNQEVGPSKSGGIFVVIPHPAVH